MVFMMNKRKDIYFTQTKVLAKMSQSLALISFFFFFEALPDLFQAFKAFTLNKNTE